MTSRLVLHYSVQKKIQCLLACLCLCLSHSIVLQAQTGQHFTLPAGPGSIDGLGEMFSVAANTGTSQYQVEIDVPPGRAGLAPDIRIDYNNGYGNGLLGTGFRLNLPFVQRQTEKGLPIYQDWPNGDGRDNNRDGNIDEFGEFDTYIDHLGNELVYVGDNIYRAEVEGGFIRYERLAEGWRWHLPNGNKITFGTKRETRVQGDGIRSGDPIRVYRWCAEKITDTHGNEVRFRYVKLDDTVVPYLESITYNHLGSNQMGLRFEYEKRPDILTDFRPGYEIRHNYRMKALHTFANDDNGITYHFKYDPPTEFQPISLLKQIQKTSADNRDKLPPLTFAWSTFDTENARSAPIPNSSNTDCALCLY